ncbi:RimJ/RimL family protein N-acetyltransferase [Kordia periserrulae]|uniref:RimJ/RimL family protein N-acetyltransferase n=1 Tax=Kordia periserrulae TaxID=701523 RepID=A0A2T6BU02_9FLAO|nr:GNAT family protein [Kordia periserrulae]PTX59561.1 RimJ/RimL family protein N-acetyltransferase [Kordia periserrulae]
MQLFLTPLSKENFKSLFKFRNELSFLENCTSREKLNSIAEFEEELENDFFRDRLIQFLVLNAKKKTIGTVYAYNFNSYDGFAFVTVFITETMTNQSYGIKAFLIFVDFLFYNYNLYKIYFDVYDFNKSMLSILKKCNFSMEGRFINQKYKNNTRHDVYRFAFYKNDLDYWKNKLEVSIVNII